MFDLPSAHLAITLVRREFEAQAEPIRPRRPSRVRSLARAAAAAVLTATGQGRPARRAMSVSYHEG